jgi:hypothetical protein
MRSIGLDASKLKLARFFQWGIIFFLLNLELFSKRIIFAENNNFRDYGIRRS